MKEENLASPSPSPSGKAGLEIDFRYPIELQDIMGPTCFDDGFGPFRWVCASGKLEDFAKTDAIACGVLEKMAKTAPEEIQQQMQNNIHRSKVHKKIN